MDWSVPLESGIWWAPLAPGAKGGFLQSPAVQNVPALAYYCQLRNFSGSSARPGKNVGHPSLLNDPPCKCGDIYPSTVAEIRHAQTNVFVFALVTALLPESTQTGNHWPEPVRPGGVQQPEEAGAQGGGCVHRPWQGWQGWSPGWVHSLPSVLLLKSSALSVHYCPPCPSVRYSFESFTMYLWININPCEVVDVMSGVFTSFQRVSFEDENKKNVCLPLKNPWRFFADFKTSSKPTAGTNIKISGFYKYKGINVGITQPNDHVFTCQPLTTSLTPARQLCRMRGCQNSNGDAACK